MCPCSGLRSSCSDGENPEAADVGKSGSLLCRSSVLESQTSTDDSEGAN